MKYKFYTTSEKAWLAMLENIKDAKHSVYLESFILTDDSQTHNFFETLKQKAQSGVKVKIIVDQVGNLWAGSINKMEFEKAGAEVLIFNRWFYRTHRKILIVDEEVGFIGGVNIKGEYADWLDLHLKVTGRIVRSLLKSFSRIYHLSGGKDNLLLSLRKHSNTRAAFYKAKLWLIERWPLRGKSALRHYYKKKCAETVNSIVIVTPYFTPHRWLISALHRAAKRGVKVDVILPKRTDVWLSDAANYTYADVLSNDLKFWFIPEMNHAKVLLVDNREGLIGSNNIDAQSFDINLEASVVFRRKDMVGDLMKIVDRWRKMAIPFENLRHQLKWYHRFFGFFVRLLQPIL
ncbi:MAG: phosphatidylserine/phosphatidylglycerophosphate/cardiolipin synthase family protein [Patescibacteria group bacterium]